MTHVLLGLVRPHGLGLVRPHELGLVRPYEPGHVSDARAYEDLNTSAEIFGAASP